MYYFEKINHNKNLPMRIFLHNLRSAPHHWHSEMELLLVLNGSITIECEGGSHLLKTNDLFLINGNMAHATSALQDNLVLVLQIDREYFDGVCPGFGQMRFLIDTTDVPQPDTACHDLRVLMARLMYVITKQEEGSSLMALSCLNRLCLTLVKKYRSGTLSGKYVVDPDNERLNQIIQYISQHFSEDISISDIADALHISRSYLSRFFSQTMGVSLSKYITDIRLKKSLDMLKNTDKNVSQIAYECGFPLAKSYYSAFHKAYGTTPAKYKRDMLPSSPQPATEFNYLEIDLPNAFQQLYMFLEEEKENDPSPGPITGITDNRIFIDTAANLGPYKNVTRKIGCFGRAAEGLRDDWRRDFTRLQKDIGYEYMRCHGIFHDEMGVYRETPKGPVYDFSNIDSLYDFLLEHRARPYVELGFMPRDLASADQTVFWWKGYIAKPKSMEKWLDLIEAFLLHLQDRYGKEELRLWYFEIWNEPDVASFWADGQESYYELFSSTYRRIKDIDPKLRVGGFSLAHCDIGPMLPWIAQKCHEDGIQPDFFSYHNYPFEAIIFTPSDYDGKDENRDSLYQNLFRQYFRRIGADGMEAYMKRTEEKVRRLFPGIKEIFVTEWNASFYPRELISDTLYMAAFVAKNQL